MADPTKKSEEVEATLKGIFGIDRREAIRKDVCQPRPLGCGGPATKFKDEISKAEYRISGLCQTCQDGIFKDPEDEAGE